MDSRLYRNHDLSLELVGGAKILGHTKAARLAIPSLSMQRLYLALNALSSRVQFLFSILFIECICETVARQGFAGTVRTHAVSFFVLAV